MFEFFGQGLARAGMYCRELTTCKGREKKQLKKKAFVPPVQASPHSQLATSSRPPATGWHLDRGHKPFFFIFFYFLEVWGMGQGFWKNGCTTPPFLKLAPILGSVKSYKFLGDWRFHFFSKLFIRKFRLHLDLHIYH
jgi:hypothetical protein